MSRARVSLRARPSLVDLLIGTVAGAPLGVWILAALPVSALNRLIGLTLVAVVALEFRGLMPTRLVSRGWGFATGVLAGILGGAVGTPGPPIVVYATTQGWSPRTMKANTMGFFIANQGVILAGYWWAGLLTREALTAAAVFALPALAGGATGVALFGRLDPVRFRRVVFTLLLVSGLVLLARG